MTKCIKKIIRRNRSKQFFYLRYPTFLCQEFINRKFYYKCFGCRKLFPTQYRLSRHFLETKCLINTTKYNTSKFPKKLKKREFYFSDTINNSSLIKIQEEYNNKKKELDSYFGDYNNKNRENINFDALKGLNDNNKLIFYKNDDRKRYIFKDSNILGEGHFGKVFCINYYKINSLIAFKYLKKFSNRIIIESSLLRMLNDVEGIPKLIEIEELDNKNNFIAQELCGPSLEKLHYYCGNKFSNYTIIKIAIQLIGILKNIHKKGILHRDLKPSNICYGLFSKNQFIKSLNIIDFNLGSTYQYNNNKNYIPQNIGKFLGTLLFANSAALLMVEQSPKDELETLFYILVYLKNGFLPWQKFQNLEKHKYIKEVLKMHDHFPKEELFKGFFDEIVFIFKAIKNLTYNDIPDYDIYIKLLESAIQKEEKLRGFNKSKYDWEIKLKRDFSNYCKSMTKRKDYIKIAFLKKGYPFSLQKFVKLFS